MNTEKIREQFEVVAERRGMPLMRQGETYASERVGMAWSMWKESRESVEVELPFLFPHYRQNVVEAIEASGLKVKP